MFYAKKYNGIWSFGVYQFDTEKERDEWLIKNDCAGEYDKWTEKVTKGEAMRLVRMKKGMGIIRDPLSNLIHVEYM